MPGKESGTSHIDESPGQGAPWAMSAAQVTQRMGGEPDRGLSRDEVDLRLRRDGENRLRAQKPPPAWRIALDQLRSVVILLLVGAFILAMAFSQWPEAAAVALVIVVNGALGFVSEWRAIRAMQALRDLGQATATVIRDGRAQDVSTEQIVRGDVLQLNAESLVCADARLLEAEGLRVNEAALTGESVPVNKTTDPVAADAPLAERTSMVFRGTTVVEGQGRAVVTATGMQTRIGRVSSLAQSAKSVATPLQRRLDRLGRRLAVIVVVVAAGLAAMGYWLRQEEALLIVETSIALGVAAIPEGLPIVATIALARGMYVMARRNALINRLTAVETLGATSIICTDKTGTLTRNRMSLRKVATSSGEFELDDEASSASDDPLLKRTIEAGVLCNNAVLGDDDEQDDDQSATRGDPMEVALLEAGRQFGLDRDRLLEQYPEEREVSFDPDQMKMATYHATDGGFHVAVKGAAGRVLDVCDRIAVIDAEGKIAADELTASKRQKWADAADEMASQGLRVLAAADKHVDDVDADPYAKLCFVGLLGLLDPPDEGVREVINRTQAAGVRIVMVTGDQAPTAEAIAEATGVIGDEDDPETRMMDGSDLKSADELSTQERQRICESNIFSRVSPRQKLNLIDTLQRSGYIVAMTGDGVNDAPALKKADIGVAMGRRGTDAARQVADMVLTDDALGSITHAIELGRLTFVNIRKAAMFMLCTNVAEVLIVATAFAARWPVPLRPLQILYLNMITDVFPAMALAVGPAVSGLMDKPPRPAEESVLTASHWRQVAGWSILIAVFVLGGLLIGDRVMQLETAAAVTVSFLTLALAKLWFPFVLRQPESGVWINEITRNGWIWVSIAGCGLLLLAAVYLPGLSDVLETQNPTAAGWALVLALSVAPAALSLLAATVYRVVRSRRKDSRRPAWLD